MSPSFWKQMLIIMLFMISVNAYYAYLAQQGSQTAADQLQPFPQRTDV